MSETPDYSDKEIADLKAMGIQFHEGLPIFPFVPDSIKESRFLVIEAGDLRSDADIQALMQRLWQKPEVSIYYYMGHNGGPPADNLLLAARNRGDIHMDERNGGTTVTPNSSATISGSCQRARPTPGIGSVKWWRRAPSFGG